jgi:hypothetical protein
LRNISPPPNRDSIPGTPSRIIIINCNWVDTHWQQYSTHLHKNSTQNAENGTYITIKRKLWEVRAVPCLCELYPGICLTTEKNHGETSARVVEKCPDIPVAVVQYTFTHKQCTKQHSETECTERNTHNNKNT